MSKNNKPKMLKYIIGGLFLAMALIAVIKLVQGFYFQGSLPYYHSPGLFENYEETRSGEKIIEIPVKSLSISNIAGSIQIMASDDNNVKVRYQIQGPLSADSPIKEPVISLSNGHLIIKRPEFSFNNHRLSVSFQVFLPKSVTDLKISSISGSIKVEDIGESLNQELITTSGSIQSESAWNFKAHSTSGSINFKARGEKIEVTTVSGSITGSLPEKTTAQAKFNSISGAIRLKTSLSSDYRFSFSTVSGQLSANPEPVELKRKKNKLEGQYGQGTAWINASTISGSIYLSQ